MSPPSKTLLTPEISQRLPPKTNKHPLLPQVRASTDDTDVMDTKQKRNSVFDNGILVETKQTFHSVFSVVATETTIFSSSAVVPLRMNYLAVANFFLFPQEKRECRCGHLAQCPPGRGNP